ncbi:MAG: hypothetical protein MK135_00405 [Polyangiaceae bacterium]|nr:hypothetical protein [Polyangiaceae bacterium]
MINQAIDLARGVGKGLIERWRDQESLRADAHSLLHLLQLECRTNLALLDALDPQGEQVSEAYLYLASALSLEVVEQLFLPGKGSQQLLKDLERKPPTDDAALRDLSFESGGEHEQQESVPSTGALMSYYVKASAMKKLCQLQPSAPGLKSLRYRTRLVNLRRLLIQIVRQLELEIKRESRERRSFRLW